MKEDSVVFLVTGAIANLAGCRWLPNRNSLLGEFGLPRAETHPAQARFMFGDGRVAGARSAADITVGIAGFTGNF